MSIWKTAIAFSLAGIVMASQVETATAGPMPTNVAAMKAATSDSITQVYWRGGWGFGLGGLAAGAIIGGAIASGAPYGYYGGGPYYGSGYGYGYPAYGYGGGYAPAYYGYGPAYPRYYGYRRYYRPYYGPRYGYYRPYRPYRYW